MQAPCCDLFRRQGKLSGAFLNAFKIAATTYLRVVDLVKKYFALAKRSLNTL
jgi:hypothetical protein